MVPDIEEHLTFKDGAKGNALRYPSVPPRAQRTTSSALRRQLVRHRRPHPPHLHVPHDGVRAPHNVPLNQQLRHQDSDTIHPKRIERVGRQLVPRHGQLRLAVGTTKESSTSTSCGVPTRSTASPRTPASNCPATTPRGETAPWRQWTTYTCETRSGDENKVGATPFGNLSTTWSSSYATQERRPPSSPPSGPRSRGSSTSPRCRARPSTCPPKPTSSFHRSSQDEGGA